MIGIYKKFGFIISIFLIVIFISTVSAASLSSYDIEITLNAQNDTHISEIWKIDYSFVYPRDLELFKENVLNANLDLEKLQSIDPNLKPHVYIKDYSDLSIGFDEFNNTIRIEYNTSDLALIKLYENEDELIWKFNNNLLNSFVLNDLYYIPKESEITINLFEPLILQPTTPDSLINGNNATFSGVSSNELNILAYEKKPPKPSFVVSNFFSKNLGFYLIFIFLIIIAILIFREPIEKAIQSFVIRYSEIKSDKKKFDFLDDDLD